VNERPSSLDDIPAAVVALAQRCRAAGARALLVGGGVRDRLLSRPVTDWDVEVFGLAEDALAALLAEMGSVNAVGRAFGVFKVKIAGRELDVSLPRRDSKVGAGHRGIHVEGDPNLSIAEAARRRDLTINAILLDPLTGEVLDPWGGRRDLASRRLRAVDESTFLEDPLRALRVVQFAARLEFEVEPALTALSARAALSELPAERFQGEWVKLMLLGVRPSHGLAFAREAGILTEVFPEAAAIDDGNDAPLDAFARGRADVVPEGRQLAAGLAIWLRHGSRTAVEATLDRLALHRWQGYPLRERVLSAVACWREAPHTERELRWLSTKTELRLTFLVAAAVHGPASVRLRWESAERLGILEHPPEPLLLGRDLQALGVRPGPTMGLLLKQVYERQLDGTVTTKEAARKAASEMFHPE
jgi:tRNA nucleotidyltransferase (CCA-adding enzyme)